MNEDEDQDLRAAIEAAQSSLMDALAINGPEFFIAIEEAHNVRTGIASVDALLPYCSGDGPQHILKRVTFLSSILRLAEEPKDAPDGRQRQREAGQAGDHILEAAKLLQGLENGALADLLTQLADTVQAHAATCKIAPQKLSEVRYGNPALFTSRAGHMLDCMPVPWRLSERFTGERGRESRRANIIRLIAQSLTAAAPLSAIARLVTEVVGAPCTHADVGQALGRDSEQDNAADLEPDNKADIDLQSVWGKPPV